MSDEKNTSEQPANKPSAVVSENGEEVTPQEATPQEAIPQEDTLQEVTPKKDTPQEATPKEATPKEDTSKEATSQEDTSEEAEQAALQEAVRLLYDEPYTAPSTPEPPPPQREQSASTCRLEVAQDGIVIIDSDEEPQRPDVIVVDDTSSPQHKIARLDDPNN